MDLEKQAITLPVQNFVFTDDNKNKATHGYLLPNNMRAIFCGPSACGKTNALLALLIHPNGLRFKNLYVYSKSLNQPKYKFLEELFRPMKKQIGYYTFTEHENVIFPHDALPNSIMIFDDIACEKNQDNVKAFFCMSRNRNVDSIYFNQSYASVRKHLIRDNLNILVIFQQDNMNLKHIYDDHVITDMSFARFKEIRVQGWREKYEFLVIDKDRAIDKGRNCKTFDTFFLINTSP